MSLTTALNRLKLTENENAELLKLLMASVAGLLPGPDMDQETGRLFCDLSDALAQRRPHWKNLGEKGYVWSGKLPEFVPEMLAGLQDDANKRRPNAVRATRHPLIEKPAFAQVVADCKELQTFIEDLLPAKMHLEHTSSFYHYYEAADDRVEPHIDTDEFALSCLMLVDHQHTGNPLSRFYVCQPGHGPVEIPLAVGDAIVFYSGSVVHTRTAPGTGETVITASWGFKTVALATDM